jgi:hypothetical protein
MARTTYGIRLCASGSARSKLHNSRLSEVHHIVIEQYLLAAVILAQTCIIWVYITATSALFSGSTLYSMFDDLIGEMWCSGVQDNYLAQDISRYTMQATQQFNNEPTLFANISHSPSWLLAVFIVLRTSIQPQSNSFLR